MADTYRIRVRRGDLEVEVESSDSEYTATTLDQYLNAHRSSEVPAVESVREAPASRPPRPPSVQEFIKQVKPEKKNEVATAIAYFLEYHRTPPVEEWKPDEIADKFADARKPKPANMRDLLVKSDYFMEGREKGSYRLSETGVAWVEGRVESYAG